MASDAHAATAGCIERAPCVYVSPDPAQVTKPGTIYVYRGRGWRPKREVQVGYPAYCPPGAKACEDEGLSSRLRTDRRGRFTFRLRLGTRLPSDVPRPAGAGGVNDTIQFVQWSGRPALSRLVTRDALPTPPPSTPAQRTEAKAVAAAFARTARALDAKERAINRSMERYELQLRQCRHLLQDPAANGNVVDTLRGLAFEGALLVPVKPHLDALAATLERLTLQDPTLKAGRDAWVAILRSPRLWPAPDLCTVMQRWSETGFDLAHAPVPADVGDLLELTFEIELNAAIQSAGPRLRALHAGRRAAELFRGELLDVADLIGET
jgi:hypothetical protein